MENTNHENRESFAYLVSFYVYFVTKL